MSPVIQYFSPIVGTLLAYVLFSTLLSLTIGLAWYSERSFGSRWRLLAGIAKEQTTGRKWMIIPLATAILGALLVSVAVGVIHLLAAPPYSVYASMVFWVAFGLGTSAVSHALQRRPWALYAIEQGYILCVVASAILMANILIVPAIRVLIGS